jgi:large subunit ribosomal protein L22
MTGAKTNERPGTRAKLRGFPMSASKARVVLNLVRGEDVNTAREILAGTTREAADVIAKILASAVANAVANDGQNVDELYVSAAYADEGITMKRFSPRARGRAGKIFKRSTHITVIVSRMDEERLERLRGARSVQAAASRSRRVASSRRRADQQASFNKREAAHEAQAELDAQAELEANAAALEASESDVATDVTAEVDSDVSDVADVAAESESATPVDENEDTVSSDTTEETN